MQWRGGGARGFADVPLRSGLDASLPAKPAVGGSLPAAHIGGQALPASLQDSMSLALAENFGDVRIHDDARSDALTGSMGARAFTMGSDLFFRRGEYRPGTAAGRELLGHELTHVVQQRTGRARGADASTPTVLQDAGLEHEADRLGRQAAAAPEAAAPQPRVGAGAPPAPSAAPPIQGKFTLSGRFDYSTRAKAEERKTTILANIPSALPAGVTQADVLEGVYDWAEDVDDQGNFKSWKALVDAVIEAIKPKDMDIDFTPFTPSYAGPDTPPSTPTPAQYNPFARRLSGDFSTGFEAQFGESTETVRARKIALEHAHTGARGTTYGDSRFMSLTGKKVLGDTLYEKFLSKLPGLTGLDQAALAQALLDGLLDGAAFNTLLDGLNANQQEAMTMTVRLLHNEIVNRSSVNLLTLVGALRRSLADASKTIDQRLLAEGLFVPVAKDHKGVGGQQLSRSHHVGSDVLTRADSDLTAIHHQNRKAIGNLADANNADLDEVADGFKKVIEAYLANLKDYWEVTITAD